MVIRRAGDEVTRGPGIVKYKFYRAAAAPLRWFFFLTRGFLYAKERQTSPGHVLSMKKIILGITGSIAAYRASDLIRLFVKGGFSVFAIMTKNAQRLITAATIETLSGGKVHTDVTAWDDRRMDHLELRDGASLLLVAPATADIIGKFAVGIADDLLSTTYLSVECPVVIAPAMNPSMYRHPAVQENIGRLKSRGVMFVEPGEGTVACGDGGQGRLAEIDMIYEVAVNAIKG